MASPDGLSLSQRDRAPEAVPRAEPGPRFSRPQGQSPEARHRALLALGLGGWRSWLCHPLSWSATCASRLSPSYRWPSGTDATRDFLRPRDSEVKPVVREGAGTEGALASELGSQSRAGWRLWAPAPFCPGLSCLQKGH